MSVALFFVIFLVIIFLAAFAAVYALLARTSIQKNPLFNNDTKLQKSSEYLLIAGVVGWATIGIIIILIILYLVFGFETIMFTGSWVVFLLAFVSIFLALAVGILSALAASDMKSSPNFTDKGNDYTAYREAIISSIAGIAGVGLIVIAFIAYYIVRLNNQRIERANEKRGQDFLNQIESLKVQKELQDKRLEILKQQQEIRQLSQA